MRQGLGSPANLKCLQPGPDVEHLLQPGGTSGSVAAPITGWAPQARSTPEPKLPTAARGGAEKQGTFRSFMQDIRGKGVGYPRRASLPPRRQALASPAAAARAGSLDPEDRLCEVSPVTTGCRCISVSTFLQKPARFLRWRGEVVGAEERSLREFFEVMVGPKGLDQFAAEGGEGCSLCLEELTAETLRRSVLPCATASSASSADAGHVGAPTRCGGGLAGALRPYLEDLLIRRQGFRGAVDLLAAAADADPGMVRVLTEVTSKDLFLALLFATPRQRRARLAVAYSRLRAPLPVVFRVVAGPGGAGELCTVAFFDVLHELACTPCEGRQVLVSLGTERVLGCGKTFLLGALALTPTAEEELDIRPSGPMHLPSCDLLCADSARWVLDVHGCWSGADEGLRNAVLAMLLWAGAVCLVHCALADFHQTTNAPKKELTALLSTLAHTSVPGPDNGSGSAAAARGRGSIVLLRDSAEALGPRHAAIEAALRPYRVLATLAVEDFRGLRSTGRRASAAERLRGRVEEPLRKVGPAATPSLEELHRVHRALTESTFSSSPAPSPSKASQKTVPRRSALGEELTWLLDTAQRSGTVSTTLFPLSVIHRRISALRRLVGGGCAQTSTSRSVGSLMLDQLRKEEEEAQARTDEMRRLEDQLEAAPCSEAMMFFRKVVVSRDHLKTVREMALYLEEWKEPKVVPLLDRQRELQDRLPADGGQEGPLKEELARIAADLAELDFSMDSFWIELELLEGREGRPSTARDFDQARACWQALLAGGQPFQLLHSRPLQMAAGFLRSVLQAIGAPQSDPRGIYVVSVIGAQSSAKSTLLNFLFGCGFAVRAGRCTRGLYATYLPPTTAGPPMLVLDSEGLLSLGSEGSVFDGQIALMCMTCSHLVLVNHKGELSRQLQDLMEVCLFALKHLRLARLQPRLAFVLRDQHDRTRAVHEDMLKQMRSHLEDAARTLGSPLQDLILLDSTAVFLLPSAVTSELRQGQEVCWTSELFAREVLHLRSEVFRWLREDTAKRAASGPLEFSSLTAWFDFATAVWDTLDQFGEQLLHYRTIHEIELRRELADVAKTAVRDALDGTGVTGEVDGSPAGFHARARQMVDSFVARMHAAPSRLDLETTDLELSRALACLRDEFVIQLEELFQERASSPRFSATAKEQAKQQIRTPIEWAFENHLYTWKLHLKKANDERAMHELWVHFTGVLNRHLASSGHRSCLSEAESHELFESEWRSYEASYRSRLRTLIKEWQTLAHEVTLLFNHAVGKLQHEAGSLALLKEVGPQQVALNQGRGRDVGLATLVQQTDEEWAEQYFYLGWWNTVKMRGLALLQSGEGNGAAGILRSSIIPRMREVVQQGLQQFRQEIVARGVLDEATAAEGLRHITGVILHDMETRLLADVSVTLKRPQMLHALHLALRVACVEALVAVEDGKQRKAMEDLFAQKAYIEEHFLLIVQTNKGDVERATNFATLYHRSLSRWLDHEVTQLAADVRSQVLQEMPDPQKSSERAFQQSFAARSWVDVLEYVLDMNAYLEKLYLTIFHQRKRAYVGAAKSRVEKRILGAYHLLKEVIGQWARRETAVSPRPSLGVDVVKGPTAVIAQRSVRDLKDFIATHAERVPRNADTAEAHRQLAERLPATADFQIADPHLFAETLQARIGDFADSPEIRQRLAEKLDKALREQSVQAWSLIRGCSERCPLCGSKCDLVGEHARHHCAHHLFPAFHGWMDRTTGLPSFNHCLGPETREGTYECKDGVSRKLEEYLQSDHPAWLPFVRDDLGAAAERDVQHLRAAWVNCREPLLEYFSPMADGCAESWCADFLEEGRALTKADLQAAKDTIRKLRNHTWAPSDD